MQYILALICWHGSFIFCVFLRPCAEEEKEEDFIKNLQELSNSWTSHALFSLMLEKMNSSEVKF